MAIAVMLIYLPIIRLGTRGQVIGTESDIEYLEDYNIELDFQAIINMIHNMSEGIGWPNGPVLHNT